MNLIESAMLLFGHNNYLVFKPRNADDPKHDPHDHSTDTKHGKLRRCVALVHGAIAGTFLPLRVWGRGGETMHVQGSENLVQVKQVETLCFTLTSVDCSSALSSLG